MTELADYAWLTAPETAPLLAELAEDRSQLHSQLSRLRKLLSPARAQLAVEQVGLRNRAEEKFGPLASAMFFTEIALQQATDLRIARYKASRFPREERVLDYCTGIGGDLLALAERGPTLGWDCSPEAVHLANANLQAAGLSGASQVRVGQVESNPPNANDYWHVDPDRRKDGRRSIQMRWHSPEQSVLERWLNDSPNGCIKLAPATEVPLEWEPLCQRQWISRDRQCRQQVAWFGALAEHSGTRLATSLHADPANPRAARVESFLGTPGPSPEVASKLHEFIYDTDPAIRAAGLTGSFAEGLCLESLTVGASYLTSAAPVDHPLAHRFRVVEQMPLREKTVAAYLRQQQIGTLEIKKRGVAIDPELLRRKLKLRGDRAATLLLTRMGKREVAILAERCCSSGSPGIFE